MFASRLYPRICLVLLLLVLTGVFTAKLGDRSNYHGDESTWIPISLDAFELFVIKHDFTTPFWQNDFFTYGAFNPPIGKYIVGMGLYLAGYRSLPYVVYQWNQSLAWNIDHGRVFDSDVVRAARLPIALMGVLSCGLLYWLVALVIDEWHGVLAALGLAGGRLLLESSRHAMFDTPALCFALLAMVGMWYLLRALRDDARYRAALWAIAVGCVCGLGVGTKMTALLAPLTCITILVLAWNVDLANRRVSLMIPICGALVLLGMGCILLVTNPFLYPDPLAGVQHMLDFASIVAEAPSRDKTTTSEAKLQAVGMYNLQYAPLNQLGLLGEGWLWLAGVGGLLATVWRAPRWVWERSLRLVVVWVAVTYIGICVWLPNAWDRYTLAVQPCSAFLEAFGALWLMRVGASLYINVKREVWKHET